MTGWDLVTQWAERRAASLRQDARTVADAYTKGVMVEPCRAYSVALDQATRIIEEAAEKYRRFDAAASDAISTTEEKK